MNAQIITEKAIHALSKRYGTPQQHGKAQIYRFGSNVTCSVNYSRLLGGHKYFYAIPHQMADPAHEFLPTELGEFAVLICGGPDKILVLPRKVVLDMLRGVTSRRVDVFVESGAYILQTTKHPKLNITDFLNAFPKGKEAKQEQAEGQDELAPPDRLHVKVQWELICLGLAEGCAVWVPVADRNLSFKKNQFTEHTIDRLPSFGFDENTRRVVSNIDVLWLRKNVIRKAFEIESTTIIYSGLLRLNDLVLAQPNNQIQLFVAAQKSRREKVFNQLTRPSFQELLPSCLFVAFENIEESYAHLSKLPSGAKLSGVIQGERFSMPDHYLYPSRV